jgi:hypothetical protein
MVESASPGCPSDRLRLHAEWIGTGQRGLNPRP